jgi:hypothetical protein
MVNEELLIVLDMIENECVIIVISKKLKIHAVQVANRRTK